MNTSTSTNNCTHPGQDFFRKIETPPTTGKELLNWIATGTISRTEDETDQSSFTSLEKAWIFNFFGQELMRHDPRFSQDIDRVDWSGQLKTLPSCLKYPRGDLLITSENENHGFVLTKFRSDPKAHLTYKDVKAFDSICSSHLNNCGSAKLYLISTVENFNMIDNQVIEAILRDDLLHPITDYTLARMFGDDKRADEMDLPSMLKEWKEEKEFRIQQALDKEEQKQKQEALKEEAKIRREERRAEKAIWAAEKKEKAAKKSRKKSSKKSSKKGKEKDIYPISEEDEFSPEPKKAKAKRKLQRKPRRKTQRKPRTKYYQHPKGTERVGWKTVILREIYQNHDEQGKIDTSYMTTGRRGKALYQQVTTRRYRVWQKSVRGLRTNIVSVLRALKKEGRVEQRNGAWYFCHPIQNKVPFQELGWEQKWEHIEIFSTLFGHLPEQKDAVNPILAELWLARQQINYAMDRRITLEDITSPSEEEESSFNAESFLEGTCSFINQNDQLFGENNLPVLLPVVS